jgi:hypothetical protein
MGRLDRAYGAASWGAALTWLAEVEPDRPIEQIQIWSHGLFGAVLMDGEALDATALSPGHPHHQKLLRVRQRLVPDALWWFRTCETFGTTHGQAFARAWTSFFGCRAAGHTHIIGVWQSGLHLLAPGEDPAWSPGEGVTQQGAARSRPGAPNTISFLHGRVPARCARPV